MSGRPRKERIVDGIIFDIDNVLIDTRHSYHDTIRWTIETYLTVDTVPLFPALKKSTQPFLISKEDVNQFKLLGGFNDDWDCCYGMLTYLLNLPKVRTLAELKKQIHLKDFAQKVTARPLRVAGIVKMLGRHPSVKIEKISRIFQEIYLGKELFKLVERKNPIYWDKRGLIRREKLIFRKSTLAKLKELGLLLGIATGRPRFEAIFALRRFGILNYFNAITTIDEVKKAEAEQRTSLRKPHPFSLLETAKKLGAHKRYMYLGDLPDDIMAARQAKEYIPMAAVAFPWYSTTHKDEAINEIKRLSPDYVLQKPIDLPAIAFGRKTA